jgi:hypothetical protein
MVVEAALDRAGALGLADLDAPAALRLAALDGLLALGVDPHRWWFRRDWTDPTPTTIEQRSSDFRTISGVQFAFASSETDLQSGKVLETTVVRSVKINPPLVPSIFEKL